LLRWSGKRRGSGFAFAELALILLAAAPAAVAMDAAAQTAAGEHVGGAKPAEMRRVALVIGNANYVKGNALANPINDATDICNALQRLEFEVLCYYDVPNRRAFKQHIHDFQVRLGRGVAGVFYYAGHGVQVGRENYLIPTQANIVNKQDIEDETVSFGYIMGVLEEGQSDFNLVVLDACRDNPFRGFTRAMTRGLAPLTEAPAGSIVLYATAANERAFDGSGRNSPFAKHMLANIGRPGIPIEQLIKDVSRGVQDETFREEGHRQTPFSYGSFTGEFCFAGCAVPVSAASAAQLKSQEEEMERLRREKAQLEAQIASRNEQSNSGKEKSRKEPPPATPGTPKADIPAAF
jgi:uncharacterized caspase-like protein